MLITGKELSVFFSKNRSIPLILSSMAEGRIIKKHPIFCILSSIILNSVVYSIFRRVATNIDCDTLNIEYLN